MAGYLINKLFYVNPLTDTCKQEQIDVFGRIISNICDQELNLTILGREFIMPPRSTFLLSNLCQIDPLYNYTGNHCYLVVYNIHLINFMHSHQWKVQPYCN